MKKIVLIDDENRTRSMIARIIESFDYDVEIFPEGENVQSGIKAIERHNPDIVFLDIQMPDGTGFDVLRSVKNKNFEVIFVTAHEEFAIKAIKFSALDYLLKPIDADELQKALDKALKALGDPKKENKPSKQYDALSRNMIPSEKRRLVLKTQESIHVVELDDIVRCEADRNYTSFHLMDGRKILVSKTLKDYETLLSAHNFLRIQQSHLINIAFVDRYDKKNGGAVVMKDESEVPLSPAKRELFFARLESL